MIGLATPAQGYDQTLQDKLPEILAAHENWVKAEYRATLGHQHTKWEPPAGAKRADLRKADLMLADLRGANLAKADLSGASLYEAKLEGASFKGANLSGATLTLPREFALRATGLVRVVSGLQSLASMCLVAIWFSPQFLRPFG